jgi:lipopolysaccharide export system protein LptA
MMKRLILMLVMVMTLVGPVWANEAGAPPPATTAKGPMKISADQALEWRRADQQYIAKGNVVITQDGMELRADQVVADYRERPTGSGVDLYRLTATGSVVTLKTPTETATGTKAVYERDQNQAVLEGPVTITRGRDVLKGARATVDLTTRLSTLYGAPGGGRVTGVFYDSVPQGAVKAP